MPAYNRNTILRSLRFQGIAADLDRSGRYASAERWRNDEGHACVTALTAAVQSVVIENSEITSNGVEAIIWSTSHMGAPRRTSADLSWCLRRSGHSGLDCGSPLTAVRAAPPVRARLSCRTAMSVRLRPRSGTIPRMNRIPGSPGARIAFHLPSSGVASRDWRSGAAASGVGRSR
jgi:hypothetical protein